MINVLSGPAKAPLLIALVCNPDCILIVVFKIYNSVFTTQSQAWLQPVSFRGKIQVGSDWPGVKSEDWWSLACGGDWRLARQDGRIFLLHS